MSFVEKYYILLTLAIDANPERSIQFISFTPNANLIEIIAFCYIIISPVFAPSIRFGV